MKRHLLLATALILSGCATSRQIVGPDGTPAHAIRCGAAVADACLEKAGELCPNGYDVLNAQGSRYLGQMGTGSVGGSWNRSGGSVSGYSSSTPLVTPNTLLVECKAPK
jgi:hypothetical protein